MEKFTYEKIYCDSNAIIHAVEGYSHSARELFRAGERGEVSLFVSQLCLHEVMIAPLANGYFELAERYSNTLKDGQIFDMLELDEQILIAAAKLRATYRKLDLADAIHITSADNAQCSFLLSDDKALDEFLPMGLKRISLQGLAQGVAS